MMASAAPFKDKGILILITLEDHSYLKFLLRNFRKHFGRVVTFNFIAHARTHGISATEKRIKEILKSQDLGIVLSFHIPTDFELTPEYYASLKDSARLVFWFFDDDMFFDANSKYFARAANAVITTDYYPYKSYQKLEIPVIYHVPFNDMEVYHPVAGSRKEIDVCFIGDCTKSNRKEFLDHLESNGIRVESFGHGSKNGFIEESKIAETYAKSRIILNFTRIDRLPWLTKDDPSLNGTRQNKGHFNQAALVGSFCLTEYAPTLGDVVEIGRDLDVFNDKDQLLAKTEYYLAHEKEREEIAANSRSKALESFTDETAFPKMLAELNETLYSGGPNMNPYISEIQLSPAFKRKYVNGLTFTFFIMLGTGRLANAAETFVRLFRYGPLPFAAGFPAGLLRSLAVVFHKMTGKYKEIYKQ